MHLKDIHFILHIEDKENFKSEIQRLYDRQNLQSPEYKRIVDVESALLFIRENKKPIDLILLDDQLPNNPKDKDPSPNKAEYLAVNIRCMSIWCIILVSSGAKIFGRGNCKKPFVQGQLVDNIFKNNIQLLESINPPTDLEKEEIEAYCNLETFTKELKLKIPKEMLNQMMILDIDIQAYYNFGCINPNFRKEKLNHARNTIKELLERILILNDNDKQHITIELEKIKKLTESDFIQTFIEKLDSTDENFLKKWLDDEQKDGFQNFQKDFKHSVEAYNNILAKLDEIRANSDIG